MSGPPRAGHIWTDPGAWFFHLHFYKKYVIIIKKSKISHENFFAWAFYQEETIYNKRIEIRLTIRDTFLTVTDKNFLKTADKKFSWKLQAKLASKILYVCQVRIFYHERGVHYKRTEMRLIFEELFWMRRAKKFFE